MDGKPMVGSTVLFGDFLYALRGEGLVVGIGEWLGFLSALQQGLAVDIDSLYAIGRALLCRSEAEFDQYDIAFANSFKDAQLSPEAVQKLKDWLKRAAESKGVSRAEHDFENMRDLWEEFRKRLEEQDGQHDGGSHWVGTGGNSPFGHSGRGANGIRVGGSGGGRQAVQVAMERRWANYRTDQLLDVRDMKVALRALRNLAREGNWELDIDLTIDKTAKNAGDIEIVEQRSRVNRVHLVLLMDAGGSMTPHYEQVNRLFSAAHQVGCFKTFKAYYFHNCVYQYLYKDMEQLDRLTTAQVMEGLSPNHRLIFVGDASMAPFELFSPFGWHESLAGLDWLRRFRSRCRASVWLNPDPRRYWRHPTVSAIGSVFPMYRLTLNGLKEAVKKLRAPI
ncbi:MAG: VWA containing CoxE family protein [Proteobacteria bacterium]|jgi:uncharacterized protein|nr:VWA containing CoxE family protein [Pseudomonadota bacterium]